MHLILAGTAIQATHLAAALRIREDEWVHVPTHNVIHGHATPTAFHILPGASLEATGTARRLAARHDIPIYEFP